MRPLTRVPARLLPLCFAIACQDDTTTPTIPESPHGGLSAAVTDNVVSVLKVIPDSQMVFAADTFRILAQPKNKAGQVLDRTMTWSVGNTSLATILSSSGLNVTLKALKVGKTSVKTSVDGKSKFSKVVIRSVSGAKVVVTPATATAAAGATVQFTARGVTSAGEDANVNVVWTTATGTISPAGVLTAGNTSGDYKVIGKAAFGAADTSIVTIGGTPPDPVTALILVPGSASMAVGGTVAFKVYGRNGAGDSVGVNASYSATGGTVAASGIYTAGTTAGTYRVIATSTDGPADTSDVTVTAAGIDHVTLKPSVAASRPGETTKFVATVWNTSGDSVNEPVTFDATCGSVTGAGVYTAPSNSASCVVTASAGGKSASTEVIRLKNDLGRGTPFGIYDLWKAGAVLQPSGIATFTSSQGFVAASDLVNQISTARARGIRVMLAMTGGSHDRYKTNGVFDMAKWKSAMDAFNTPAIRAAVADGVADGTVLGNSVMDEPQQHGNSPDGSKTWGPSGTMTKVRVDSMCTYVKNIFPTMAVGVGHDHQAFEPTKSYQVCEFIIAQYATRKGDITAWRDGALALGARDAMAIVFSLNMLDGGIQHAHPCPIPLTGGDGTYGSNCNMTPDQIRNFGKLLGASGCTLLSWRWDSAFLAKPENQEALSDIAITLSTQPHIPCTVK